MTLRKKSGSEGSWEKFSRKAAGVEEKEEQKRNVRGIFLAGEAGSEGGGKRRKNMKNGEKLRKSEKNKRQVVEEKVENFVEFFCYQRNFKCYQ